MFLMTLTVLNSTGQIYCRMSPGGALSEVFLMIRLQLHVFGRKTTELNLILITMYQHDITIGTDLDHELREIFF